MAVQNYTSTVTASKSIGNIEKILAMNGAQQIIKTYSADGQVVSVCFSIKIHGHNVPYMLPSRLDSVVKALRKAKPRSSLRVVTAQAERTAWKNIHDWVKCQMTLIQMSQVDVAEVLLPFMYNPAEEKTFYELAKDKGVAGFLPAPQGA